MEDSTNISSPLAHKFSDSMIEKHWYSTGPLALCMFFSGYCGIIAELSLFTLAESLIGGTLINLLATMGVMMFCMGLGALIAGRPWMARARYGAFITLELLISSSVAFSIPSITYLAGWWPGQTHWAFIAASASIGTLIGMEIPLMQKMMQDESQEDIQVIASRVMMADYFGSLCGFILFSSQMLHILGLPWTALSSSLLNFSIALIISFKKNCPKWGRWVCLALASVFFLFSFQLNSIMDIGEQGLYRHKIIWREQSPYQKLVLVDQNQKGGPHYEEARYEKWKNGSEELFHFESLEGEASIGRKGQYYSLFINGGLQFNSMDEGAYHEHLIHPLFWLSPQIKRILVMGAGDGLAVREILKYPQIEHIELVELDPAMTEAFSTHPLLLQLNQSSLLNPKVHITHQDAWTWARQKHDLFDAIVLDFPDPHHLETAKLYSLQFYKLLRLNLLENGALVTQATSPLYDQQGFGCIRRTLEEAGFGVCSYHVEMASFGQWGFHIASPNLTEDAIKSRLWNWQGPKNLAWFNQEVMRGSLAWRPHFIEQFDELPINDFLHLPLLQLYRHH